MNVKNLSNWVTAACAVFIGVLLLIQQQQQSKSIADLKAELRVVAQAPNRHLKEQETNFGQLRQQLDDLVAIGALFQKRSKPASEAVLRAKSAEKSGDLKLANIYYLSAINHAPAEMSPLTSFADVVLRDGSATAEDLAQLKSVLQISLYQVPPTSITNVLRLLDQAAHREHDILSAQVPKTVPVNWQERLRQIEKSNSLESSWASPKKLSERWDALAEFLEVLQEEEPGSDLVKEFENNLETTRHVLAAARMASAMDMILKALDSSSDPEKAISLLQTAEGTMAQLWGIDASGWPALLRAKVDGYPNEIRNRVERVAELKSEPFLREVLRISSEAKSYEMRNGRGKLQAAVLNYDLCIAEIRKASSNVSSKAGREKAETILRDIEDIALKARRKQFDEYQIWALERCNNAFNSYRNETSLSDEEAKAFFRANELAKIDQTLLSPEVSRVFNDVLGKITSELDGTGAFTIYQECAETKKARLEDF